MQNAIISDTSCLILLQKIGELELLHQLFGTIITTAEVAAEYGMPLPAWIHLQQPTNINYQSIIETLVDKGEASTIALAVEMKNCLLIIDDNKAKKLAHQLGLRVMGSMGIIVDAKRAGIITSVKPVLEKIKQTNFRINEKLEKLILAKAGEI